MQDIRSEIELVISERRSVKSRSIECGDHLFSLEQSRRDRRGNEIARKKKEGVRRLSSNCLLQSRNSSESAAATPIDWRHLIDVVKLKNRNRCRSVLPERTYGRERYYK